MKQDSEIAGQLRELRGLTGMTGGLHDAQVTQLKCWGWGAFPHVHHRLLEIRVDTDEKVVTYAWPKAGSPPKDLPKRVGAVVVGLRQLLGPEWKLRIEGSGKLLYEGKRLVSKKKAEDERKLGIREEIERIGRRAAEERRPRG